MFTKTSATGKTICLEKFYDEKRRKWRQAQVTMNNASRQSLAEAKRLLLMKIAEMIEEPTEGEVLAEKRESLTVYDVYQSWREIKKVELKETTYFSQGQIFEYLLRDIRDKPIISITVHDMQEVIFANQRTTSTKRNYKSHLQQFFDFAVDLDYISENPVKRVKIPKRKVTVEDVKKSRERYIDMNDLKQLIDFVNSGKMNSSNNHKYYEENQRRYLYAYIFMFSTGLRIGELQALRYKNITGNIASIEATIDRRTHKENDRVLTSPKTVDSYRDVILNAQALQVLEYFSDNKTDENFIFVNAQGKTLIYKTLHQNFRDLCQRALGKAKSPHMLRHGFVSMAKELGIPEKAIMAQVGHAKSDMTLHYTHLTDRMREETSSGLNGMDFSF